MMNEEKNNYRRTGILAVLIFSMIFIGYNFFYKEGHFSKRIKIYSIVDNAAGIEKGTSILTRGFKVGEVTNLKLVDNGVLLELFLHQDFRLNKSAQFSIVENGLFGGRVIEIDSLKKSDSYYVNGDTIYSKFKEVPLRNGIDSTAIKSIEPSIDKLGKAAEELFQKLTESSEK